MAKPIMIASSLYKNVYFDILYVHALDTAVQFVAPVTIMLFMNYKLVQSLRPTADLGMGQEKREKQTVGLTRRVIAVATVFIVLESPLHLTATVYSLGKVFNFSAEAKVLLYHIVYDSYILSTINSFANFYIYCLTGSGFRKALNRMVTKT
jgi:hypothetical protein